MGTQQLKIGIQLRPRHAVFRKADDVGVLAALGIAARFLSCVIHLRGRQHGSVRRKDVAAHNVFGELRQPRVVGAVDEILRSEAYIIDKVAGHAQKQQQKPIGHKGKFAVSGATSPFGLSTKSGRGIRFICTVYSAPVPFALCR